MFDDDISYVFVVFCVNFNVNDIFLNVFFKLYVFEEFCFVKINV